MLNGGDLPLLMAGWGAFGLGEGGGFFSYAPRAIYAYARLRHPKRASPASSVRR